MTTSVRRWLGVSLFAGITAFAMSGCAADAEDGDDLDDETEENVASTSDALSVRSIRRPCDISRASLRAQARSFCNVQSNFREVYYRAGICRIGLAARMWFTC